MKRIIYLIPLLFLSCNQPQQGNATQEQIKADYDRILSEISIIQSELLSDTLDMGSPRYNELIRIDDSLKTAIFKMYPYEDLKTFFEEYVKGTINEYQYQNLLLELEEYKDS